MKKIYKGVIDKELLESIISKNKINDIKAMCIWGVFTGEVPGIHLGHLHIMNKLLDLAKEGMVTSICINETPVPDKKDVQEMIKRLAGMTAAMLHALSDLMPSSVALDAIYVGMGETDKLRKKKPKQFKSTQQILEKARSEIERNFVPLREEGPLVSDEVVQKFQSKICKSLKINERTYSELVELFVVRNKAHASTRWASEFGSTMHLMKKRPSFLLVGKRHGYIWALYDCMFRRAGLKAIPVVRVEDFMDCVGKEPMNSRDPGNCIPLLESEKIIRDNLSKGKNLVSVDNIRAFALRDVFEKLIFPRGKSVVVNNTRCVSYKKVLVASECKVDLIVKVAVDFLKDFYSNLTLSI